MSFKPGFIAPPWPHTVGDSIRADSLIQRVEDAACQGCGLHYEIYHHRTLSELNDLLAGLSAGDAETFRLAAAKRGFHLGEYSLQASREAYDELWIELRKDQL